MKKRLSSNFFSMRLRSKIALLCTALIVASTVISGYFLYRNAAEVTTETEAVHASKMVTQVNNYLNEKLKGIITRIFSLRTDSLFNETAARFLIDGDPRHHASALSYFSNVFMEMRYSEPFIASMFLYTPKESFYDLSLPYNSTVQFSETEMYKEIMEKPNSFVYWFPSSKSELYRSNDDVISFVVRFSISGYSEELYMVVHLKEERMMQYLIDSLSAEGSSMLIVDNATGEIIVGDAQSKELLLSASEVWDSLLNEQQGMMSKSYVNDSYMIHYVQMNVAPWTLVNIQSQKSLLEKLNHIKLYSLVIILVSVIAGVVFALLTASTISKPLRMLEKSMQRVRRGQFNSRFEYAHRDEVGNLGRAFNFMTEEINDLIEQKNNYIAQLQAEKEQVQKEQRLKRIAELKALQSQMTPHFLYNTLDTIKWKAEKEGKSDIAGMITTLAAFFRISLSRGKEIITVKEEMAHIASYLSLQQTRYHDQFSYEVYIDPVIEHCKTVKFILQPLVENAIYHGIKQLDRPGRIMIRAERDAACMKLSVEDNGPGMHPVKLKLICKHLQAVQEETADGYGLFNVNDRIKLYFGKAYGLHVESEAGKGTKVTACIPLQAEEGGEA